MGRAEQKIIESCQRQNLPLPKKIQEAPELLLGLEFHYHAFQDLSYCRPGGMALMPIPWTTVVDYARAHDLDEEETDDLIYLIRRMDQAYLDYQEKKQKREREK